MEAQPGGGRVIRLVAEGLDPISLPNLEFDGPDQLLGAVSRSIGLSNAQLALWDAVQGAYVALGEWSGRLPDTVDVKIISGSFSSSWSSVSNARLSDGPDLPQNLAEDAQKYRASCAEYRFIFCNIWHSWRLVCCDCGKTV